MLLGEKEEARFGWAGSIFYVSVKIKQ